MAARTSLASYFRSSLYLTQLPAKNPRAPKPFFFIIQRAYNEHIKPWRPFGRDDTPADRHLRYLRPSADKKTKQFNVRSQKSPAHPASNSQQQLDQLWRPFSRYDTPADRHLRNLRPSADKNLAERRQRVRSAPRP